MTEQTKRADLVNKNPIRSRLTPMLEIHFFCPPATVADGFQNLSATQ